MSGIDINSRIDDKEIMRVLSRLQARGEKMRPLMQEAAGIMADEVEENFEKEGRPKKWEPLAPATIRQRERAGTWPGRILQQRGSLAASHSQEYGNEYARVGTNKVYAAIQNFGGKAGRGRRVTIPARTFQNITDAGKRRILDAAQRYVEKK